ncbi:hypothetical protein AV521_35985 [Streptomyces sp. IMTB 2501]|uniref:hypothetical protein n=1 Tax=Streptomyces sp. IMTB 2501 TaxID=1776340 RepID=UPI00096D4529|nr:hypothetical protein [Streptomyces sp. IMTB 2501]OLZ64203.1 hypothetical protein AV521_35985 [Streptomyces sp. IMTB 2501]
MKKRSILALASLATGFAVAAVTPAHAQHNDGAVGDHTVKNTVDAVDHLVHRNGIATENAFGQDG